MTGEIPQVALRARHMYVDGHPVSDILAETGLTRALPVNSASAAFFNSVIFD